MVYSEVTRSIRVSVDTEYLDDQSSPRESRFVWAYHIRIENESGETVQLLNRHWRITDSAGRVNVVDGAGVVGHQPVLNPGDSFEYTSGTPLAAPSGVMVGRYEMQTPAGERFNVAIPAFSLDSPHDTVRMN